MLTMASTCAVPSGEGAEEEADGPGLCAEVKASRTTVCASTPSTPPPEWRIPDLPLGQKGLDASMASKTDEPPPPPQGEDMPRAGDHKEMTGDRREDGTSMLHLNWCGGTSFHEFHNEMVVLQTRRYHYLTLGRCNPSLDRSQVANQGPKAPPAPSYVERGKGGRRRLERRRG